jgi:dTDP-4-dehydrorhamnose reductase
VTRVLVTGSTGLLGSTLGPALESHGCIVIRHGRDQGDLRGDLTDECVAAEIVAQAKADCTINLAALTDVDQCERHPQAAYLQNTRVVENLVAAMRRLRNPCHLVQISTDQLYDGPGPHREEDIAITNYYGFSKYAGELAAMNFPSTILRTNFFGHSHCAGRKSFSDWIVGALERQEAVRVFEDVWFNPLSITRLAQFVCLALDRRICGVFNLGSKEGMTKADFCFALARLLGLSTASMQRASRSTAGLRAYRPTDMRMDCGRFEGAFGVELPTFAQEIESMKGDYHACV